MPIGIKKIDNDPCKLRSYDDLAIPRLIRRHERQYFKHLKQNKGENHNRRILGYKMNLLTNRLFYNIEFQKLYKC